MNPDTSRFSREGLEGLWWAAATAPCRRLADRHGEELAARSRAGWQDEALCAQVDPEAWFPDIGVPPDRRLLALCADCPVRRSCLAAALLGNEAGIWAGTTPNQRTRLYRMLDAGHDVDAVLDHALTNATETAARRNGRESAAA
jgi:hypothetical protein